MPGYSSNARVAPKTMTKDEQEALLRCTNQDKKHMRDHILILLALATGLRQHELVALNVGDVFRRGGKARKRVQLKVFKRSGPAAPYQEIMLAKDERKKLEEYYRWKKQRGEGLEKTAPLFMSRKHNRLATRTVRHLFTVWQERAELDRTYTFHALRHSAAMNHYRASNNIRLTQRFLRHKNLNTTMIYTLPTDEELAASVERMSERMRVPTPPLAA
ncbi:MAG: phage integrase family protein [Deltaproteobacteria bacterium]|nr:phage integrase family protein [Deltaproteobacteria bacterium]